VGEDEEERGVVGMGEVEVMGGGEVGGGGGGWCGENELSLREKLIEFPRLSNHSIWQA